MTIVKWDPYKTMKQVQDSIDSLFKTSIVKSRLNTEEELAASEWAPDVDIFEDDEKIVIKADLPEVDEKDFNVMFDNSILIIKGTREFKPETSIENYRRIERPYGTFLRKFAVPSNVDTNAIKAEFSEGIVRISLPKTKK